MEIHITILNIRWNVQVWILPTKLFVANWKVDYEKVDILPFFVVFNWEIISISFIKKLFKWNTTGTTWSTKTIIYLHKSDHFSSSYRVYIECTERTNQ